MRSIFVLMYTIAFAFVVLGTVSGARLVVDDDGGAWADHTSIQDAIDSSSAGDVIRVFDGDYAETKVVVSHSLSLLGNGSASTILDGIGTKNVMKINNGTIVVSGLTVTNATNGINITDSVGSSNVTVINCTAIDLVDTGIHVAWSEDVNLIANHLEDCGDGIWVNESERIFISNSSFTGMFGPGGVNWAAVVLNDGAGNVTMARNHVYDTYYGFYISQWGVRFWNIKIVRNHIHNITYCGIFTARLSGRGPMNLIAYNHVYNITSDSRAIYVGYGSNVTVVGNNVHDAFMHGISLSNGYDAYIANNSFYNNGQMGIRLYLETNATVIYNEVFNNTQYGIALEGHPSADCEGVLVHHNNVGNNGGTTSQGLDEGSNQWDDGSVGNYWSDWNGTGEYDIDGGNQTDRYPQDEAIGTSAPEKIPEFAMVTVLSFVVVVFAAVFRKRRLI